MRIIKKIIKLFTNISLALFVFLALLIVLSFAPLPRNIQLVTVGSDLMLPGIQRGGLLFTKPAADYVVGDVIVWKNAKEEKLVQRVYSRDQSGGNFVYYAKGDKQAFLSSEKIQPDWISGKVFFDLPFLGYLIDYVKTPLGLLVLIIIPSALIVFWMLRKIRREAKKEVGRRPIQMSNEERATVRKKTEIIRTNQPIQRIQPVRPMPLPAKKILVQSAEGGRKISVSGGEHRRKIV